MHSVKCCEIANSNDKCDSVIQERSESLSCPPLLDTRLITLVLVTYAYHVEFLRVHIGFQTNSKITYYSQSNCVSCIKNRCKTATYATTADERRGHYYGKYGSLSRPTTTLSCDSTRMFNCLLTNMLSKFALELRLATNSWWSRLISTNSIDIRLRYLTDLLTSDCVTCNVLFEILGIFF